MLIKLRNFKSKEERKQDKKYQLERNIKEYMAGFSNKPMFREFCSSFTANYYLIYNTYPRNRIAYYISGLHYGVLTVDQYHDALGVNQDIDAWSHVIPQVIDEYRQEKTKLWRERNEMIDSHNQQLKVIKRLKELIPPSSLRNHKIELDQTTINFNQS